MSLTDTLIAAPLPLEMNADGVVRVGKTRVTLDTVVTAFECGATAEEIAIDYDALELADVYAVINYYLRHRAEVEGYLAQRRRQADEVKRTNELRSTTTGIRDRLLARRVERR